MKKLILVLAALLTSVFSTSAATPSMVQEQGHYFGSAGSNTLTFANPTNNGDMYLVCIYYNVVTTVTVSDNQSDVFSIVPNIGVAFPFTATTSFTRFSCFYSNNIAGGASTTITITYSATTFAEAWAIEISGQSATTPFDKSAAANATGSSAASGSVTTTSADLVFGFFQCNTNNVFTPTGGFSALGAALNATNAQATIFTQGSPGAINATATSGSNNWTAGLIAIAGSTATLTAITVTPNPASVVSSSTIQMVATGFYSDGSHHTISSSVAWSSGNPSAATIAAGGLATGVAAGSTVITATLAPAVPATAVLNVTQQIYDIYGGLILVPCTNTNTAFSLVSLTLPGHGQQLLFCTPAGHGMFSRGFYVQDYGLATSPDETGTTGDTFAAAKYGSVNNAQEESTVRVASWGMNTIGPFGSGLLHAPSNPTVKIPFVGLQFSSEYALTNRLNWGTGPAKDFFYYLGVSGAPTNWGGFHSVNGMCDWHDPNWVGMIRGIFANDGGFVALAAASTSDKNYLLGISLDESDGTHGLGAGPDFATQPAGNNDFALGYVGFFIPSVSWANTTQAQIYTTSEVYLKFQWRSNLIAKYTTIGALNTAWTSSYSSFDSSGTVVGTHPFGTYAASVAADLVGTGNGVQTVFPSTLSHTAVSKYSLGIFTNGGVLVAGDTGGGALFGPNVSGTINYSTGAISVTFAAGHAPANGITVTAEYVANGWGIGTGFMDEDCRTAHASYCGSGSGNTTVFLTGIPANVQTDINALTKFEANFYSSTSKTEINNWGSGHGFTGNILNLGPSTTGTWSTPSSQYVVQGICGNQDTYSFGGQGAFSQAENDFMNTNCPGIAIVAGSYRTANADSPFSWPNSATTHVGATATATLATPFVFTTSDLIDVVCDHSDYNKIQGHFSSVSAGVSVSWAPTGGAPVEANAVCNVFYDDNNEGGFPSQAARALDFQTKISALVNTIYTTSSLHPYVSYLWWQYQDKEAEKLNWGPIDNRDNNYDGLENVMATPSCQFPLGSFPCGGELRANRGGNAIAAIIATNAFIDCTLQNTCGGTTAPNPFFVAMPLPLNPPGISQLSPASSYVTSAGFSQTGNNWVSNLSIKILGSNFQNSSTVSFDGTGLNPTFINSGELDVSLPANMVSLPRRENCTTHDYCN